jgi:hypothetical protein
VVGGRAENRRWGEKVTSHQLFNNLASEAVKVKVLNEAFPVKTQHLGRRGDELLVENAGWAFSKLLAQK